MPVACRFCIARSRIGWVLLFDMGVSYQSSILSLMDPVYAALIPTIYVTDRLILRLGKLHKTHRLNDYVA